MASKSIDRDYQITNLHCMTTIDASSNSVEFIAKIDPVTKLNPKSINLRANNVAKIFIQKN